MKFYIQDKYILAQSSSYHFQFQLQSLLCTMMVRRMASSGGNIYNNLQIKSTQLAESNDGTALYWPLEMAVVWNSTTRREAMPAIRVSDVELEVR